MEFPWSEWTQDTTTADRHYRYRYNASGEVEYQYYVNGQIVAADNPQTPRTSQDTEHSNTNQSPEWVSHGNRSYLAEPSAAQPLAGCTTASTSSYGLGSAYAVPTQRSHPNQNTYAGSSQIQGHLQSPQTQSNSTQLSQAKRFPPGLHESFKVTPPKSIGKFFFPGRVFSMLWIEPASPSKSAGGTGVFTVYRYNEKAFAEIRRFIVMNATNHRSLCIPISTYRGYGVLYRHDANHHAVAYTSEIAPTIFEGENIDKHAIRVKLSDSATEEDALHYASRVNFSDTYTVQHNVKVKKIGVLGSDDLNWAMHYWKQCLGE